MAKSNKSNNKTKRPLIFIFGVATLIAIITAIIISKNQKPQLKTSFNTDTTQISGIQGNAETLDLADYADKIIVVNYMAGWCNSCWAEIPDFVDVYEKNKSNDLIIVGISLQTPNEQTLTMINEMGISYPVYQDETGKVAQERFNLRSMPSTFIFNKDGKLIKKLEGEVSAKKLLENLKGLL